jgi:hypothetical protein
MSASTGAHGLGEKAARPPASSAHLLLFFCHLVGGSRAHLHRGLPSFRSHRLHLLRLGGAFGFHTHLASAGMRMREHASVFQCRVVSAFALGLWYTQLGVRVSAMFPLSMCQRRDRCAVSFQFPVPRVQSKAGGGFSMSDFAAIGPFANPGFLGSVKSFRGFDCIC